MKVDIDDIVVVEVGKTEKSTVRHIVKVAGVTDSGLAGRSLMKGTMPIQCELKCVLANLGPEPKMGWVYGYHISGGFEGTVTINNTDFIFKVKPPEGMVEAMSDCMNKFPSVFGLLKFRVEVHGPRGARLGFWAHHKRSDIDTMGIHTTSFSSDEIEETMIHELGHGVWYRLMDEKLRARFIQAYTHSIDVHAVPLSKIREMAKEFDKQRGSVRTYMKEIPAPEKALFKKMLEWIKEVHHISREDIDKLRVGDFKVAEYFPTHSMVASTVNPVITEYATTKPVEFFCEGWAHYWLRKQMPRDVVSIMDDLCTAVGISPR